MQYPDFLKKLRSGLTCENVAFVMAAIVFVGGILFVVHGRVASQGGEAVKFHDRSFEQAAEDYLDDTHITKKEAERVRKLKIDTWEDMSDLQDLRYFPNLRVLIIKDTSIERLDGIEQLPKLRILCVRGALSDVSALYRFRSTKLQRLNVSGNQVNDMNRLLENFPNLQILRANHCGYEGPVGGTAPMKHLEQIDFSSNRVTTFSGSYPRLLKLDLSANRSVALEADMPKLRKLDLDSTWLESLDGIFRYGTIRSLKIKNNPIDSIRGIRTFKELRLLDLRKTKVQDISELEQLESFHSIYLNRSFDRSQIDFMVDRFRSGDRASLRYIVGKREDVK